MLLFPIISMFRHGGVYMMVGETHDVLVHLLLSFRKTEIKGN